MRERDTGEKIKNTEEYWNDPRVVASALRFLGGEGDSWKHIESIKSAYLGVGTLEKLFARKKSPVSTLLAKDLESAIEKHHGNIELFTSFLQKNSPEHESLPVRSLFCWDVDQYIIREDGNYDEASLIA